MKEVCDLDREQANFAWCFDCVPEENSLLLGFAEVEVEVPALDLVLAEPNALLGEPVHGASGRSSRSASICWTPWAAVISRCRSIR
jgi:hypothetical protein